MTSPIVGIGVIIPARNEVALLEASLTALERARRELHELLGAQTPWVRIILVLDSCTDGSDLIAANHAEVETLSVGYEAVGAARFHGIRHLLHSSPAAESEVWIANTDADSEVPPNWLCVQWQLAAEGADVVVGTVRPNFNDLSDDQRRRWLATHPPGEANGHVHGANLGFRADLYRTVGGFEPVQEHEDVLLVKSMKDAGAQIVATGTSCVFTSGRAYGRTPGGYASHLRERL